MPQSYLLFCSVGPVGDFIQASRRTRDLFTASELVGEWARCVAAYLKGRNAALIFPPDPGNQEEPVTDRILAVLEQSDAEAVRKLADETKAALTRHFQQKLSALTTLTSREKSLAEVLDANRLTAQAAEDFLEFFAAWHPLDESNFGHSFKQVEALLNAREQTTDIAGITSGGGTEKSSLDGRSEDVLKSGHEEVRFAFGIGKNEHLGAVDLLKRCGAWESGGTKLRSFPSTYYIAALPAIRRVRGQNPALFEEVLDFFESVESIKDNYAFHALELFSHTTRDSENEWQLLDGQIFFPELVLPKVQQYLREAKGKLRESLNVLLGLLEKLKPYQCPPYLAVVAADGDGLSKLKAGFKQRKEHLKLAQVLSSFAAQAKQDIKDHEGHPIYLGGDDLLFFAPVDRVLEVVDALRQRFQTALKAAFSQEFTISFGVAIHHMTTPLRGAMIRSANDALDRAKQAGKNRLTLSLVKGNGAPLFVTRQWPQSPTDFLREWVALFEGKQIPQKLPYELRNLADVLTPILSTFGPDQQQQVLHGEIARIISKKDGVKDKDKLTERACNLAPTVEELKALAEAMILARFLAPISAGEAEREGE